LRRIEDAVAIVTVGDAGDAADGVPPGCALAVARH
jgi:hypothetical protein